MSTVTTHRKRLNDDEPRHNCDYDDENLMQRPASLTSSLLSSQFFTEHRMNKNLLSSKRRPMLHTFDHGKVHDEYYDSIRQKETRSPRQSTPSSSSSSSKRSQSHQSQQQQEQRLPGRCFLYKIWIIYMIGALYYRIRVPTNMSDDEYDNNEYQ